MCDRTKVAMQEPTMQDRQWLTINCSNIWETGPDRRRVRGGAAVCRTPQIGMQVTALDDLVADDH